VNRSPQGTVRYQGRGEDRGLRGGTPQGQLLLRKENQLRQLRFLFSPPAEIPSAFSSPLHVNSKKYQALTDTSTGKEMC